MYWMREWSARSILNCVSGKADRYIFDSIGFRMGSLEDLGLRAGRPLDLAFSPERNHWNGQDRVQLRIKALRMSGEVS